MARSRTEQGFVPNCANGGGLFSTWDRTEPAVLGKVLLKMHQRWNCTWLVRYLLRLVVGQLDWFHEARRVSPLGLVGLGSNAYAPGKDDPDDCECALAHCTPTVYSPPTHRPLTAQPDTAMAAVTH